MLEIITIIVVIFFIIHMTFLIMKGVQENRSYNQTIFLSGGRYASVNQGGSYRIVDSNLEEENTILKHKNTVTSSFSCVYVRLYQLYTGKCYDAYLENTLQIGRSGGNNAAVLILDDPMVSKKHCMLYRRGDQILIQDLESTNHTYVNGCKIEGAVPITHGDQLSLGNSQYQFQCYYQR